MNLTVGIVGVLALGALYVLMPIFAHTYSRLRGKRVVRCPETAQATEIALDAAHGAAGVLVGRSTLRVHECECWKTRPDLQGCDQECLKGVSVEAAQSHALLTPHAAHDAS